MKIERMNTGSWGKVKAFFDVLSDDGFTIKGFKLIDGINGLFVSMPSRQGTDDQGNPKYFDNVWIESKDLRQELNEVAISEYQNQTSDSNNMNQEMESSNYDTNDTTPEVNQTVETGSNLTANNDAGNNENTNSNTENIKSFSDDDVPF